MPSCTSVYIDSAHAQAVVQGIQSYLSSENDLNGTCSASPNCVLGIFDDVETIDNPDGTTSPSSTHTVHYAVWSQGNIVGEVAVSHAPDQADSTGASYADGMIKNGAVLLSELLAGQQPAAPTATPTQTATSTSTVVPTQTSLPTSTAIATSTPTRTATATPTVVPTQTSVPTSTATPTPTPTAMATAGRLSFSVLSVKLAYGSAKPGNGLHRASLGLVRPGQNVKLLMYVRYSGIQGTVPVRVGFRVLRAGRTAYFVSTRATSSSADNGGATAYWTMFRPKLSGAYTFNGTISVETKHKHKSVTFKVAQS